jgi:hypothetical protein
MLESIERVTELKILGLSINAQLQYNIHIKCILSKLACATAMLLKLKLSGFPRRSLRSVYQALFVPHLIYCSSLWGFSTKALTHPLQVQQNKAIRIIFGMGPRESTRAIMAANSLPLVSQITAMSAAKFIYCQAIGNGFHPVMRTILLGPRVSPSNMIPTRSQATRNLYVPAFNSERRRRTVYIKGVNDFNSLPATVRCPSSVSAFRARLRKYYSPNAA